jgi:uncharacterized protein YraI
MLKRLGVLLIFVLSMLMAGGTLAQTFPAEISGDVNLRSGPGIDYNAITVIPDGSPVTLLGRNSLRTWVYLDYNGQNGWVLYRYVNTGGRIQTLPVVDAAGVQAGGGQPAVEPAPPAQLDVEPPGEAPAGNGDTETVVAPAAPSQVISNITNTSRQIFRRGQELGNRPGVFAKVGDSIIASDNFLDPIASGTYRLDVYSGLESAINFFRQTGARNHNSFGNDSMAMRSGFTTASVLDSDFAPRQFCQPEESPLVCEYRLIRPSMALIVLGTNDVAQMDGATYEANLIEIVETSVAMGVIPVLATTPDRLDAYYGASLGFNDIVRSVSARYDVPLWDLHASMQGLDNVGLSFDGVHPSYDPVFRQVTFFDIENMRYGYNMLNLTALQVLDAMWRNVLSG